ncbi:hypothetical protein BC940DRAFT_261309 [Gongronella butleri]|nr:hypothetical protein BC940DRAFT_261309 [Gongronella butleri]
MSLPKSIAQQFNQIHNPEQVAAIVKTQDAALAQFQETRQQLATFNNFSKVRYQQVHKQFEAHTKVLRQVKTDLDSVFVKLRKIKALMQQMYPEEAKRALEKHPPVVVEDD